MFFEKNNLAEDEIKKKDLEYQDISLSITASDLLWKEMRAYFSFASKEDQDRFKFTYWRWFVDLTWKNFNTLSKEDVIYAFSHQIAMALASSYNILDSLLWYLGFRASDRQEAANLYQKIKSAFLESEEMVGRWQGQEVKIKDLVSEYVLIQQRGADSIAEAEFISKLKQLMFPKETARFVIVDSDVGVDRFLALVEFFQEISSEDVWLVVDLFLNPEIYDSAAKQNTAIFSENKLGKIKKGSIVGEAEGSAPQNSVNKYESMSQKLDAEIKAMESVATPVAKVEPEKPAVPSPTPKEASVAEAPAKLSATQIKSKIESEFKQDLDGNFVDIEGVMRKLEEFAETYNDPKIADMIYYDEEDDKFKWKV